MIDCHQGGYFTTLALSSEEKQQVCSVICPPEVNIPSSSIRLFSSLASFFADSFLAFFVSRGFVDSFLFLSSEVSEFNWLELISSLWISFLFFTDRPITTASSSESDSVGSRASSDVTCAWSPESPDGASALSRAGENTFKGASFTGLSTESGADSKIDQKLIRKAPNCLHHLQ